MCACVFNYQIKKKKKKKRLSAITDFVRLIFESFELYTTVVIGI